MSKWKEEVNNGGEGLERCHLATIKRDVRSEGRHNTSTRKPASEEQRAAIAFSNSLLVVVVVPPLVIISQYIEGIRVVPKELR